MDKLVWGKTKGNEEQQQQTTTTEAQNERPDNHTRSAILFRVRDSQGLTPRVTKRTHAFRENYKGAVLVYSIKANQTQKGPMSHSRTDLPLQLPGMTVMTQLKKLVTSRVGCGISLDVVASKSV